MAARRALVATVAGMSVLLLLSLLAMPFDGREIRGVSVWVKPTKFAASLAVWCATMAWAIAALAPAAREGWALRGIVWVTIGCTLFEAGWIALRAAFGEPSHFARDPLGAAVYAAMGAAALALCLAAAAFGVLVALRGEPSVDRALRLAVAVGFVVSGLGGAFTGFAIGANEGPYLGGVASDAGAWPPFFWSRDGGDLRVAHFFAVHAMQALPLVAWLTRSRAMVGAATLWWVALGGAAFVQALGGRAML